MANVEHVEKLRLGVAQWNHWRQSTSVRPDLVGADLSNQRLEGIDLSNAFLDAVDFRKSDLRNVLLQRATITSADFSGAELADGDLSESNLNGSIFQGTSLARVKAQAADFTNAVIADCDLNGADCSHARFHQASLKNVSLGNARLTESALIETAIENSHLGSCDLTSARILKSWLKSCDLGAATLTSAHISEVRFNGCSLRKARIDRAYIEATEFEGVDAHEIDASSSVLIRPSLVSLNLATALLFDTRIIDPIWPLQPVRADVLGAPTFAPTLFRHPVHDVKGLSPSLRRTVADAQLLREYWENSVNNSGKRIALRLWGITCNYGQSIFRWTMLTLCVLFAFSLLLRQVPFYVPEYSLKSNVGAANSRISKSDASGQSEDQLSSGLDEGTNGAEVQAHMKIAKPTFFRAFCFSAVMFTTLGFSDMTPATGFGHVIVVMLVVVGYAMLGALISILANKLARLS
jgi:uncharacterized protein YjbI with pentapeptide repeats